MKTTLKRLTVGGAMVLAITAVTIAQAHDEPIRSGRTKEIRQQFPATASPQEVHRLTYAPGNFL